MNEIFLHNTTDNFYVVIEEFGEHYFYFVYDTLHNAFIDNESREKTEITATDKESAIQATIKALDYSYEEFEEIVWEYMVEVYDSYDNGYMIDSAYEEQPMQELFDKCSKLSIKKLKKMSDLPNDIYQLELNATPYIDDEIQDGMEIMRVFDYDRQKEIDTTPYPLKKEVWGYQVYIDLVNDNDENEEFIESEVFDNNRDAEEWASKLRYVGKAKFDVIMATLNGKGEIIDSWQIDI